jgi:hypothetical protein
MILAWKAFQRASKSSAWNLAIRSTVKPAIDRRTPDDRERRDQQHAHDNAAADAGHPRDSSLHIDIEEIQHDSLHVVRRGCESIEVVLLGGHLTYCAHSHRNAAVSENLNEALSERTRCQIPLINHQLYCIERPEGRARR